ncbi:MAG TPA: sigma-70 family RNA polymerase sigma factor [Ktedonosporobacter sp.]|nr:sigma-70 family RNA polymerase sigma factor [Ktedonosporobacter sp.]
MQETIDNLAQLSLPGERQRLRLALLTDQDGLLTATRQRLARLAHARGVEPTAIDDVVQETLLEAWSHLERLHSPGGFHPWIDEICRNICRRYARCQQENLLRYAPLPRLDQDDEYSVGEAFSPPGTLVASSADPLEELSRQELVILLDRALGVLPQETRQIVAMCHLQEIPHGEVAARLGISSGTLQTRLHRARRQLRQALNGPLRHEAETFGLTLDQNYGEGWRETSLWCSQCGRARLQGCFIQTAAEGQTNIHVRCPDCSQRYGMDTVHSMGLVALAGLRSWRPAWKRTLQGLTDLVLQALLQGFHPCPCCGNTATMQVMNAEEENAQPAPLGPYRFWLHWYCTRCGVSICSPGDLPSIDQIVYWSHPQTRQFMAEHPRWLSTPGTPLDHAGQPALSFHLADVGTTTSLTALAHCQTLQVLAIY